MIKIQNRSPKFTILYLPTRSLRFGGKEIKTITEKELASDMFKKREQDFRVIEETKKSVTQKRKSKKTSDADKRATEAELEPINLNLKEGE